MAGFLKVKSNKRTHNFCGTCENNKVCEWYHYRINDEYCWLQRAPNGENMCRLSILVFFVWQNFVDKSYYHVPFCLLSASNIFLKIFFNKKNEIMKFFCWDVSWNSIFFCFLFIKNLRKKNLFETDENDVNSCALAHLRKQKRLTRTETWGR